MQAKEAKFLQFLDGSKQFVIPIYQRKYSWTLKECGQLWKDIEIVTNTEKVVSHFIGSIVHIQKGILNPSAVNQLMVIDGQQRLTTIILLLTAITRVIKEQKLSTRSKLIEGLLFNLTYEDDQDEYYKLILTEGDNESLIRLLQNDRIDELDGSHLKENYNYFYNKLIGKSDSEISAIYTGIHKLIVVDVGLDHEHDNPQLIFESLNSTGLDLSQADLIRNYVLMSLSPSSQKEIYKKYWQPMEQKFSTADDMQFNRFMRDYLTIKTRSIPNIKDVYSSFKGHAQAEAKNGKLISEVMSGIYDYANYYSKVALLQEKDADILAAFTDIADLGVEVAYPFLIEMYAQYIKTNLSKIDLIAITRMVENYVFRRSICGMPTNSLNKTFASLVNELDSSNYVENCKAKFLAKLGITRFPLDEEFQQSFLVKDVYNITRRQYLFSKLENYDHKEKINIAGFTIEHIMPQNPNLSQAWQNELGEHWKTLQNTYLHTMGNLTLTHYNSELSDKPFLEKRDMKGGFADTTIRLSKSLAKLEHWNETEIKKRANELIDTALKIWPAPKLANPAT